MSNVDALGKGWYPCGDSDCEAQIQEETQATIRCIPLDQPPILSIRTGWGSGRCVCCGKPAKEVAIFARAY